MREATGGWRLAQVHLSHLFLVAKDVVQFVCSTQRTMAKYRGNQACVARAAFTDLLVLYYFGDAVPLTDAHLLAVVLALYLPQIWSCPDLPTALQATASF